MRPRRSQGTLTQSRSALSRIPREARLPICAVASVAVAIAVVVLSANSQQLSSASAASNGPQQLVVAVAGRSPGQPSSGGSALSGGRARGRHHRAPVSTGQQLELRKAVGQLIIGTYSGSVPPPSMLAAVRAGQLGAVILMGGNTTSGIAGVRQATSELQSAARAGGNPGLLIMTDQEGGQVRRLQGPPVASAMGMGASGDAGAQGAETAALLRSAGINVDLAPVADVSRVNGFMTQEQRTFGSDPEHVARAACAFANSLANAGVAYTLKHFPGLGDAIQNTDTAPVAISEPASEINADDAAYRQCGHGALALVMVSSASYASVTGSVPAVLSPYIYDTVMPSEGIDAVTISDSFESGSIARQQSPAMRAINAGVDMVMYPDYQSASTAAYQLLLQDAETGRLNRSRVGAAASRVLALKHALGLT